MFSTFTCHFELGLIEHRYIFFFKLFHWLSLSSLLSKRSGHMWSYLNLAHVISGKETDEGGGRAWGSDWLTETTVYCFLLEPLYPHIWNIHRLSTLFWSPYCWFSWRYRCLLLFVSGQERKALGRKEERAWFQPLGPRLKLTFFHKGTVRDGGWILMWLLF